MDKSLLDTDILSEVLKGRDPIMVSRADSYRAEHGRLTTSVITIVEIVAGLQKSKHQQTLQRFASTIHSIDVLPLEVNAGLLAGEIQGALEMIGRPIGRADPLIAAIAISHNLTLVTGNARHFQQLIDLGFQLRIDDWRKAR